MPRKGAKVPGFEAESSGASVAVVSGSIRTPDDPQALTVKLSIWETEVTMRVDGAELGNWETSEVSIRPIDSTSFEFIAEGDQLIFTPDDPAEFVASPLVRNRAAGGGRRKGRKARRMAAESSPAPVVQDPTPSAEGGSSNRRAVATPKQSRRERKAAERAAAERAAAEISAAGDGAAENPAAEGMASAIGAVTTASPPPGKTSAVRAEAVPSPIGRPKPPTGDVASVSTTTNEEPRIVNVPSAHEPEPEPVEPVEPVERPPRQKKGYRGRVASVERSDEVAPDEPADEATRQEAPRRQKKPVRKRAPRDGTSEEVAPDEPAPDELDENPKEKSNRMWIRALDTARKYDFLGLDRVPVNESLRGQEHQHTWDHRVAPPSGPGKHICTICGEIRR